MGTTALITGASSGLGREFAALAARDGYDVLAVARSVDKLAQLKAELEAQTSATVYTLGCDLAREGAGEQIEQFVTDNGLTIDVLVNNAGFGSAGDFVTEVDWQRERDMVQVNQIALMDLMKRFMPAMRERRQGCVLNVASLAAMLPGPGMATYYASKAFVRSFSEAVAAECEGTGVSVTALCLGPAATNWAQEAGLDATMFNRVAAEPKDVAAEGWKAMKAGKTLCYFGALTKGGALFERLAPRVVARRVAKYANSHL